MRAPIDQYIIDQVRELRIRHNKSQEDLAYDLGFESKGYIGAIESMNPERTECYNSKHLNDIARLFNCSPKDFWPNESLTSYIPTREQIEKKG